MASLSRCVSCCNDAHSVKTLAFVDYCQSCLVKADAVSTWQQVALMKETVTRLICPVLLLLLVRCLTDCYIKRVACLPQPHNTARSWFRLALPLETLSTALSSLSCKQFVALHAGQGGCCGSCQAGRSCSQGLSGSSCRQHRSVCAQHNR